MATLKHEVMQKRAEEAERLTVIKDLVEKIDMILEELSTLSALIRSLDKKETSNVKPKPKS